MSERRPYVAWIDPAAAEALARLAFNDEPERWQHQARCAETDPDSFFPEKGGSTKDAKKVCASCPVRRECLEYALSTMSASASGAACPNGSAGTCAAPRHPLLGKTRRPAPAAALPSR